MGGILHRSGTRRDDDTKIKMKKDKRKQRRQEEYHEFNDTFDQHDYPLGNTNENQDPNIDYLKSYELWNNKYDHKPTIDINDAPGAPRSYSPDYSLKQNDTILHPWSSSHDTNNTFYPTNMLPSVSSYNMLYDPNQQFHPQMSNQINENSPKTKSGERSPKRVQFAPSPLPESFQPTSKKPLTNTRSWHESQPTSSVPSGSMMIKPMRLSNRSSINSHKTTSTQTSVQKPIYVVIDHQATLVERSKRRANKRQRQNLEENSSDRVNISTNHQLSRSHTHHQHKHRKPTDSPRSDNEMMLNKYFETLQPNLPLTQRPITKSTSTNKMIQNIDQITFLPSDIKSSKSRNTHRQQSAINTENKPLKTQDNRRQRPPSGSPLIQTESSKRRIEYSQSNSSVIRVPLSRTNQQSTITPKTTLTRTRI